MINLNNTIAITENNYHKYSFLVWLAREDLLNGRLIKYGKLSDKWEKELDLVNKLITDHIYKIEKEKGRAVSPYEIIQNNWY